jgi:hypothetical protein
VRRGCDNEGVRRGCDNEGVRRGCEKSGAKCSEKTNKHDTRIRTKTRRTSDRDPCSLWDVGQREREERNNSSDNSSENSSGNSSDSGNRSDTSSDGRSDGSDTGNASARDKYSETVDSYKNSVHRYSNAVDKYSDAVDKYLSTTVNTPLTDVVSESRYSKQNCLGVKEVFSKDS